MQLCDVVINGAGPAGCATAIALAQKGIGSCVIDRGDRAAPRPGEMLQPASRPLLERLKVCLPLQRRAHGVSSAWGSDALEHNDFLLGTHGDGWLLDRRELDAAMAAAARDAGATFTNGEARGAFVVDATGAASAMARARGDRKIAYDHLSGVFATIDGDADGFTLIEAVEHGWWYSAGTPGGGLAVAFMSDADIIRAERMNDSATWLAALRATHHTRKRAGAAALRGGLHIRSAASAILDRIAGPDWLAVGDAASTWDPLSASGIHKALCNAIDAANAIAHGATDPYERSVRAAFDSYLATRDRYYALVDRWPASLFWQRRGSAITLDPMATLHTRDDSQSAISRIDPRLRIETIFDLCRTPRRAHDVVAACASQHDDATVIRALQAMLREGVLDYFHQASVQ